MKIYELKSRKDREELINYMREQDWGAAKKLARSLQRNSVKEDFGRDTRVFFARVNNDIVGFFALVNKDYIDLDGYKHFIAMIWVDPSYRGRGYSRDFVSFGEEVSGYDDIYILTQHKGLYEKMGYCLIDSFEGRFHPKDYLYYKDLR